MASDETRDQDDTEQDDEAEPQPRPRKERRPEARAKERRATPPEEEPIPVFGGRLLLAAALLAAMVVIPMSSIGNLLEPREEIAPTTKWAEGKTATVAITLITADYNKLACASDKEFEGTHCQYKSEKELWPREPNAPLDDNKADVIQPYRTATDNQLLLVAGLWAQPEVALRLHNEPPSGVAEDKLARFIAQCEVKFVGALPDAKLRWNAGASWGKPDTSSVFVAKPISCKVQNPP
jgi:hypothetical protein